MNCDQVRDLTETYALGALDPADADAFEAHLAECDRHDDDLVAARALAVVLAASAPDSEPPEGFEVRLRERVFGVSPRRGSAPISARLPRWAYAVAAVMVLAIAGLAAWNVALLNGQSSGSETFVHTYSDADGRSLLLEREASETRFDVAFAGLQPRPAFEVYELWVIRDEEWLSVGRFNTRDDATWSGEFAFQFMDGDVLCVTVQSAADENEPFGTPLIWAPL